MDLTEAEMRQIYERMIARNPEQPIIDEAHGRCIVPQALWPLPADDRLQLVAFHGVREFVKWPVDGDPR